ncbi:hypothetical protein [Dyadobacter sp. NIV53]|uniref:hypothetical protein n=1 Tax=Dyadobacter sp. NIV53 TaxID=2861765 RepID=UPI001E341783|nr:hypothetical protein [Dyadobacter sp. NIV53]
MGVVLIINVLEYLYPQLVPYTYTDRVSSFIDGVSAYIVVAFISYFCTNYIRLSYEKEKQSVLEKSLSIEEKNLHIINQNLELERLNAEKNKLMSIIAHDLRSPLGNIQHYLELLTEYDIDASQKSRN